MPFYEYRCEANGRTLEAMHAMDEVLTTWGEVCDRAGEDVGDTDPKTPVTKLFSASLGIAKGSAQGAGPMPGGGGPCGAGCGCHPS